MRTIGITSLAVLLLGTALLGGCGSMEKPVETGFLSDYSKLAPDPDRRERLLYIAPDSVVRRYRSFIVDPVEVYYDEAKSLSDEQLEDLAQYFRGALVEELDAGYYNVAVLPAAGVARLRVAITDIRDSNVAMNLVPPTRVSGEVVGGAAFEAELVDSVSGEQIGAVVEARLANRLNLPAGWTQTGDAKAVMKGWAKRFRTRLDAVHVAAPQPAGDLPEATGFLSTYSYLTPAGPASLRYVDPANRLARYDKFMIRPVEAFFHERGVNVSDSNTRMLEDYMHQAIVDALADRYQVVTAPAWDVAEVRVALTDIKRSTPILNVIPRVKLTDVGLGGMAMEAEILDSVSSVQIGALVESATGRNLRWDTTQFDDARGAMTEWAKRFRQALDDAHANADQ